MIAGREMLYQLHVPSSWKDYTDSAETPSSV